MSHQVFISYSSQNVKVAQAACHVIEENGFRCWMAPRDITPGSSYADLIDEAIQSCDVFVLIFSKSSSISKWVRSELNLAFERQAHIIPFRVDDTPLSGSNRLILNQTHWIDAYPEYEDKLNELVESIRVVLSKKNEVKTQVDVTPRPKYHFRPWHLAVPLVVLAMALFMLFGGSLKNDTYVYDAAGLYVQAEGLSEPQKLALDQILGEMVYVEGGTFVMGNMSKGDELWVEEDALSTVNHDVTLKGFYISKYELTQEQWLTLMGDYSVIRDLSPRNPVDYLSWDAANKVAENLAAMTGLPFSLPTEAQWEYCAKGGSKSEGYIYSGSDNADDVAWIASFDTLVHRVGLLDPNELGLYDMTGNVSEWCLDYYGEYEGQAVADPAGPHNGKVKVIRGGNIDSDLYNSKVTVRGKAFPAYSRRYTGVRLVINLENHEE